MSGGPGLRLCRWRALSLIRGCRLGKMMERCRGWRPELAIGPDVSVASAHRDLRLVRQSLFAGRVRLCLWPAVRVNRVA